MFGYLILFFCFLRCFPKLLFRFFDYRTDVQSSGINFASQIQISGRPESFLITDTDLGFAGFFFSEKQFLTFLELILWWFPCGWYCQPRAWRGVRQESGGYGVAWLWVSSWKMSWPTSKNSCFLREASVKCCIHTCGIRQLWLRKEARSVEESNGAEAWRLTHSRYAPDTQNRQYALMQKIMVPVKRWCKHTWGFESGLKVGELDVG